MTSWVSSLISLDNVDGALASGGMISRTLRLPKSGHRFETPRILSPISLDKRDGTLAGRERASWT